MKKPLITRKRDFLTGEELSTQEWHGLIKLARRIKKNPKLWLKKLEGQSVAMIFDKSSTRTRVSFEVAMTQLGGNALFLSRNDLQLGRGEPVGDTARVLSRYVQGIVIRTYGHGFVEELAQASDVPVINALTDLHHPCQVLADLLTIEEIFGKLKGVSLTYVGDGNNMSHSLMLGCARAGLRIRVVTPKAFSPDREIVSRAKRIALLSGGSVDVSHSLADAHVAANALYTDAWVSMGQEREKAKRKKAFKGYKIDEKFMKHHPKAVFLHCLPAYRGEEVSSEVLDGRQSRVLDQAENRLHAQKALLLTLLKSGTRS